MATLTLRNVPDDLVARLKERAKRHRRSLNSETIAALELADAAAGGGTPPAEANPLPLEATLKRMDEVRAGLQAAATAEGRVIPRLPSPPPRTPEEVKAQLDRFAELRSRFKGPPLTSEEIIAAIERESHPPERQPLTGAEGSPP
jgi:hypothetical protein